jgi:hypothetical protein
MDPLGAQLIRRPGHLSECSGKDVLDESSSYILNFKCFLLYRANLILSCMQEYFCLVKGVSEEMDKGHRQTHPHDIYRLVLLAGAKAANKA